MKDLSTATDCRFCGYIRGENVDREIDNPWYSDGSFSAFISQGAFIKGWTVIVPHEHMLNMSTYYDKQEFWAFVAIVKDKLENLFGPTVMFEHGAIETGSLTGCGTDHAHIHLVPIELDFLSVVQNFSPNQNWQKLSLRNLGAQSREYLLFSDSPASLFEKCFFAKVEEPISQFFRKVLARHLEIPHLYDYKTDDMLELCNQSLDIIRKSQSQPEAIV